MIKERNYLIRQVNMALDLSLGVAAFFLAHWARQSLLTPLLPAAWITPVPDWAGYAWLLLFIPPLTVLTMHFNDCYGSQRLRGRVQASAAVALSVAEAAILAFFIAVVFREEGRVSRIQTGLIAILLYCLIELRRGAMEAFLRRRRQSDKDRAALLLVGSGKPLESFIGILKSHPHWRLDLAGVISDSPALRPGSRILDVEVVGVLSDALDTLRLLQIDEVVVAPAEARMDELFRLMRGCEEMGLRVHFSLGGFGHRISRPTIEAFHSIPVATFSPTREIGPALFFKAVFDRVAAAVLAVLGAFLFAFAYIAVRRSSDPGEPVLFSQTRIGLNGKPFVLWKFRTMRIGAEQEREALEESNEADGPVFKMRDDPRITPTGRFLRRWSLDELPQLWNVLKGEMSLVGPRPPLPEEVENYDPWQRRRLSMRPGITCLWQVSGRSSLSFKEWMALDLRYIDNWSLWLDFKILVRTAYVVLTGRGAM